MNYNQRVYLHWSIHPRLFLFYYIHLFNFNSIRFNYLILIYRFLIYPRTPFLTYLFVKFIIYTFNINMFNIPIFPNSTREDWFFHIKKNTSKHISKPTEQTTLSRAVENDRDFDPTNPQTSRINSLLPPLPAPKLTYLRLPLVELPFLCKYHVTG